MTKEVLSTNLICSKCGHQTMIFRKRSKLKTIGHVKHMYCPYCKETTPFIEFGSDITIGIYQLKNKEIITADNKILKANDIIEKFNKNK